MTKVIRTFFMGLLLAGAALPPAIALENEAREGVFGFFDRYTSAAQEVILYGLKLVGVPYRMGGIKEESGLDCSGFVRLVFQESLGTLLPRTAKEMSHMGDKIDASQLKPGDLVFFNTMRRTFSHVGIYIGDNHFIHAPRAGAEIRVEDMNASYWTQRYNGARRVIDAR